MRRFFVFLAVVAVGSFVFGCGTDDDPGTGSAYDDLEAAYLGAFNGACSTAVGCYGASESSLYPCELYLSTVRVGIEPAIHGFSAESDCYSRAYDLDPVRSRAFWQCQAALEADLADCLRSCPTVSDACHVGRADARGLCAAPLTDSLRAAMSECF